jgi:hypothetical protein
LSINCSTSASNCANTYQYSKYGINKTHVFTYFCVYVGMLFFGRNYDVFARRMRASTRDDEATTSKQASKQKGSVCRLGGWPTAGSCLTQTTKNNHTSFRNGSISIGFGWDGVQNLQGDMPHGPCDGPEG